MWIALKYSCQFFYCTRLYQCTFVTLVELTKFQLSMNLSREEKNVLWNVVINSTDFQLEDMTEYAFLDGVIFIFNLFNYCNNVIVF